MNRDWWNDTNTKDAQSLCECSCLDSVCCKSSSMVQWSNMISGEIPISSIGCASSQSNCRLLQSRFEMLEVRNWACLSDWMTICCSSKKFLICLDNCSKGVLSRVFFYEERYLLQIWCAFAVLITWKNWMANERITSWRLNRSLSLLCFDEDPISIATKKSSSLENVCIRSSW